MDGHTRIGRIVLHLLCAVRDGQWAWHWRGARRELRIKHLPGQK